MALFYTERIPLHTLELFANKRVRKYSPPEKLALFGNKDASVKSTLPPRFWSVGVAFAVFFGLLAVASVK